MSNSAQSNTHDQKMNIYQRMTAVQKAVKSVDKNEHVQMKEGEKGYKAVTHDDVAAALHEPLANAGIFMLPNVTKYSFSNFEINGKYGPKTWYRTDLEINVKWINVDNPSDFIESTGAAYALDSSDKSFAKAYSLALKIVLLKVHLLESRDGEEERQLEKEYDDQKKPSAKTGPNQASAGKAGQSTGGAKTTFNPQDFKMPINVGGTGGKALKDLDNETLAKIINWAIGEQTKDQDKKAKATLAQIESSCKAVLKSRPENPPAGNGTDPNEPLDQVPTPEDEPQTAPVKGNKKAEEKAPGIDDYILPRVTGIDLGSLVGLPLKRISEKELRAAIGIMDKYLKSEPPPENMSEVFGVRSKIVEFFKAMGVK